MFHQVWYQGGMKATVSGVVEDLNFKISEGSYPNWCFPDSAETAKGQLISKCLFEKIVWTKIPTKNLIDSAQQV